MTRRLPDGGSSRSATVSGPDPGGPLASKFGILRAREFISLERDSVCLNRKGDSRGDGFLIQDAGWGWGPASDGKTLFTGPTGSGCRFGNSGAVVPGDGGAVWGKRGQRGEVVAALAADG